MTDVYGTALTTIRAGAPGLSDATCEVIARTIARKLKAPAPTQPGNQSEASSPPTPAFATPTPNPISTAPADGTLLRLWVRYPEGGSWTPLDDARESWTVGFNNRDNTEEDQWQVVGWCWSHDHLVEAADDVEVLGWLPLHGDSATAHGSEPEWQSEAFAFLYSLIGGAPATAANVIRKNPEVRARLHRAIYERRPREESYDAMMARLLPNGLPLEVEA